MGTSSSGTGAGGSNPLIPSWIEPPITIGSSNEISNGVENHPDQSTTDDSIVVSPDTQSSEPTTNNPLASLSSGNRFTQPKKDFNRYLRSSGSNKVSLRTALKGYARNASGNTKNLARRMQAASSRISSFYNAVNTIRLQGVDSALKQLNLSAYANKSIHKVLSALTDVIFSDTNKKFVNTQDDSITKQAYTNTINRICLEENVTLDNLSPAHIQVMVCTFIEETIAQRVICDIGNDLTKFNSDVKTILQMEKDLYQIIKGLVRNKIEPEITNISPDVNMDSLESHIEHIYKIAFDAIALQ